MVPVSWDPCLERAIVSLGRVIRWARSWDCEYLADGQHNFGSKTRLRSLHQPRLGVWMVYTEGYSRSDLPDSGSQHDSAPF